MPYLVRQACKTVALQFENFQRREMPNCSRQFILKLVFSKSQLAKAADLGDDVENIVGELVARLDIVRI